MAVTCDVSAVTFDVTTLADTGSCPVCGCVCVRERERGRGRERERERERE